MLGLSNEPIRHNLWSDRARRYVGIYLKAPVIEDLDFTYDLVDGVNNPVEIPELPYTDTVAGVTWLRPRKVRSRVMRTRAT